MRRSLFQCVAALGALIAFAIVGTGPRADAAYIPTGGRNAIEPVSLESSSSTWIPGSDDLDSSKDTEIQWQPADCNRSSSTSTGVPQASGGSDFPTGGMIPVPEVPPPVQVQYLRAFEEVFDLFDYIDCILDPPRYC